MQSSYSEGEKIQKFYFSRGAIIQGFFDKRIQSSYSKGNKNQKCYYLGGVIIQGFFDKRIQSSYSKGKKNLFLFKRGYNSRFFMFKGMTSTFFDPSKCQLMLVAGVHPQECWLFFLLIEDQNAPVEFHIFMF